jgi:DNA (cytosine-5)-methyltransferase 1
VSIIAAGRRARRPGRYPAARLRSRPVSVTTVPSRTSVRPHRGQLTRLPRHPDAPDPGDLAAARGWIQRQPRPRALDLFCGAGGLSLGLREAGFSVVAGADVDHWAVETHTANVGGLGWVGDLGDPSELLEHLDGWGIDHVELIAGGVPCQPFSRAGRSKLRDLVRGGHRGWDPRAELWKSFMAVVERLRPDAVLVENVPDLPAWDDGAVLAGFLESLGALGYSVDAQVVDCFRLGIPQHRARLFLVALRDGRVMHWPQGDDELVSLRDAIGDLPPIPGGQRSERIAYRPRPGAVSGFQARMRRDLPPEERAFVRDHITRAVRPDDWEAFDGLAAGQTYADVPEHLQRYRSDIFTDKYKRLEWEHLSRTVTAHIAKDGYWYIHPEQHRTLSIREAARLQTFPDRWRFAGQPSHRYAQIGNAVPPMAAEAIARAVLTAMAGDSVAPDPRTRPREALTAWHATRAETDPAWRSPGATPWAALVGEMFLARTPRPAADEMFTQLTTLAPTAAQAASCPKGAVEATGLSGSAARRLLAVAKETVSLFDGEVPAEDVELQLLPGVGDGVSGAVRSFGHGDPAVLLDTGTARVAERVFGRSGRRRWQLRLDLHRLAVPIGPDDQFNRSLTRLAAEVCRPARPRCPECPLRRDCAFAAANDDRLELP